MNLLSYLIPLILLITSLIFLFIPIQVHLHYHRHDANDNVKIGVKVLFFTFSNFRTAPLIKLLSLMSRKEHDFNELQEAITTEKLPQKNWLIILRRLNVWIPKGIQVVSHAIKLTAKILKPIKCKKLNFYGEVGLIDASKTGIVTGSMWAMNGYILTQLSRWMIIKPENLRIKIVPNYTKNKILINYDCIIVFPLGHIIIVLLQTARFMRISHHLLKGVKQ